MKTVIEITQLTTRLSYYGDKDSMPDCGPCTNQDKKLSISMQIVFHLTLVKGGTWYSLFSKMSMSVIILCVALNMLEVSHHLIFLLFLFHSRNPHSFCFHT